MGCAFVDEDKVGEGVAYWQGAFAFNKITGKSEHMIVNAKSLSFPKIERFGLLGAASNLVVIIC